jgi:ABC-type multidrug transport system fused ATPase/permease subunit
VDDDLREAFDAEKATLRLRTILFPAVDASFLLPVVAILVWGAYLVSTGSATVGAVTTVTLYAVQVIPVVWELIFWLDELQVGGTSLSRIVGVHDVPSDRVARPGRPSDEAVVARGVRYAYRPGHDVLHGVDLDLQVGERLAVVGPSGAGKSTLGRMLAGIHPPTGGTVAVGGVPLVDLPLDELRGHVALVTQEHHVFVGTIADNLRLAAVHADDAELVRALEAVDAWGWVGALPDGLATAVGSGGAALTPAQAQQLALARLVLLDPHTLVLDEATSLLDPRAARHLERSLSAVLEGRTVVAIAHRLHTAHDADRVAVVDAGRITEIGSHDELVSAGGDYAALWHSWQRD